jgi:hypothetical protein
MEFFNDNGVDPLKPSLFELLAQEQLRDLLQPALKYALAVLCQFFMIFAWFSERCIGICPTIPTVSVTHSE